MANRVPWLRGMLLVNCLLLLFLLIWASQPSPVVDFACYYTAAHMLHSGASVYDLQAQLAEEKRLTGVPNLPFLHLPYELVLVIPLLGLGFHGALWAWRAFVVALLVPAYLLMPRYKSWLLIGAFFPVFICFFLGQDSTLSLLIFAASYWLLARDRELEAGAVLALGIYKPHLVLVIAAMFLVQGRKKFFLGFCAAGLALLAISTAMVGVQGMRELYSMIQATQTSTIDLGVRERMMPNFRGLLVLLFDSRNVGVATAVLSIALFGGVSWMMRGCRSSTRLFSVAVCCAVLCSFNMNSHDLVQLLIPMTSVAATAPKHWILVALTFSPVQIVLIYFSIFSIVAILVVCLLVHELRSSESDGERAQVEARKAVSAAQI